MKVKKTVYDAATGEYKTVFEEDAPAPEETELEQEPTLEEQIKELKEENIRLNNLLLERTV